LDTPSDLQNIILLTWIANISGTDGDIKNQKKQVINYDPFHVGRKNFVKKKVIGAHVDTPKVNIARAV